MSRVAIAPDQVRRPHHARGHRHGYRPDHELPPRRTPPSRLVSSNNGKPRRPKKDRPLRVLVLMDKACVPPESTEGMSEEKIAPFRTERDVCDALAKLGHEVHKLGVQNDLDVIRAAIDEHKPQIAFNLLEGFDDFHVFDQ